VAIKTLAEEALLPAPELVRRESQRLACRIEMLASIENSIKIEQQAMAETLVQLPGFYLTTIPGLGIRLAGHILAEWGEYERAAGLVGSYAGIVPREFQTGGPDSAPVRYSLPRVTSCMNTSG
jgi:transposase